MSEFVSEIIQSIRFSLISFLPPFMIRSLALHLVFSFSSCLLSRSLALSLSIANSMPLLSLFVCLQCDRIVFVKIRPRRNRSPISIRPKPERLSEGTDATSGPVLLERSFFSFSTSKARPTQIVRPTDVVCVVN